MYCVSCSNARPVTNDALLSSWTWIDGALGTRLITRTRVRLGWAPTPLPLLQLASASPRRQTRTVSRRRRMIGISTGNMTGVRSTFKRIDGGGVCPCCCRFFRFVSVAGSGLRLERALPQDAQSQRTRKRDGPSVTGRKLYQPSPGRKEDRDRVVMPDEIV